MALEAITVTLTTFDKLEVLRTELKTGQEELQAVERDLRSSLRTLATHRYLKSISPYYGSRPAPPEAASIPEIEKRRAALYQVIQAIRAEMPRLEATVSGQQPSRAEARRSRFE